MNTFLIIVVGLAVGYLVAERLKVPPILAAIAIGVVAKIVAAQMELHVGEEILFIRDVGIMLLLFNAGVLIELPDLLKARKHVGLLMASQFLLLAPISYVVGQRLLPHDPNAALYGMLLVVLNSTAVVLAALVAKGQSGTFAWNVLLGLMVAQDIVAAIVLTIVSTPGNPSGLDLAFLLGKTVGVTVVALLVGRLLPKWLNKYSSPIGVALGALAWAGVVGFATLTIGLSREIGAFIAGLAVSRTVYKSYVATALEFLSGLGVLVFFVVTGFELNLEPQLLLPTLGYAVLILLLTPIVLTLVAASPLGRVHRSTAALIGAVPNQSSEFILVIATLAVANGKLQAESANVLIGAVVIAMIGSVAWSTVALEPFRHLVMSIAWLRWLDRWAQETEAHKEEYAFLILGDDAKLAERLAVQGKTAVVLDDPDMVMREAMAEHNYQVLYAPMDDVPSLLRLLSVPGLRKVFSTTFTASADDRALTEALRALGENRPQVVMMVASFAEAETHRRSGLFTQVLSAEEALNKEVLT